MIGCNGSLDRTDFLFRQMFNVRDRHFKEHFLSCHFDERSEKKFHNKIINKVNLINRNIKTKGDVQAYLLIDNQEAEQIKLGHLLSKINR